MSRFAPRTLVACLVVLAPMIVRAQAATDAARYLDGYIDRSVDPRQDFFKYAVGGWLKKHPIPAAERGWGIASVVQDETYARVKALSEDAAADRSAPRGSARQKLGDFWAAAMDSVSNTAQGMRPLAGDFARIEGASSLNALLLAASEQQYVGVGSLMSLGISQDEKQSDRWALHAYQGGLGMPDRDYYFDTDARARMLRREYVTHVQRIFALLGDAPAAAAANANAVMSIETDLARASRKLEELRDPQKNYHPMPLSGLSALTPAIPWNEYLAQQHLPRLDSVIVGQPEFYQQLQKTLTTRSLPELKAYFRWQLAHTFASAAGGAFDRENFRYFGTILSGTKVQRPRWKRMLDRQEAYLGDALGQLYVQRYFSPATKQRYERLVEDIFQAFAERIKRLDWMSAETKTRALAKLAAVDRKVGYPAKFKEYASYEVDRSSLLLNVKRGNAWQSDYVIAKLGKPVDRSEWFMTPQTYNAYYNPSNNEIVLPAAAFILPGIADSLVDDALVYSYAGGSTIGHEITHGFDDQGRQFDALGNLKEWWTPEDAKEFTARAAKIIAQFDGYVVVDRVHANGSATQGENIADLGGVQLGWDAFQRTAQYKGGVQLGGLTPAQRYFIGWAISWMNQVRPEALRNQVKTDVHAPSYLRGSAPLANLVPFYEAYGVKAGDRMFRPEGVRVRIW